MNQVGKLQLSHSRQGKVLVTAVSGRLTASGGDLDFRREIADSLEQGERLFVLDFHDLQTLDSSGLGELMSAASSVDIAEGRMAWAACPRTMLDLLKITNVEPAGVDFYDTAAEAVAALG